MCIAVVVPEKVVVTRAFMTACARSNRDGCGVAYINSRGYVISKKYTTSQGKDLESFIDYYNRIVEKGFGEHKMLLHFRMRTAGEISKDNAHPFPVKNGAFVHNGHLNDFVTYNSDKSDTRAFAEAISDVTEDCMKDIKPKLEKLVGSWNKMAFLWSTGNVDVLNPKSWAHHERTGLLLSTGLYGLNDADYVVAP